MRVENKRTYDGPGIYVGRPSQWGNPFPVGADRASAIRQFRQFALSRLDANPGWLDSLAEAEVLVCWCAPLSCHADVLVEFVTQGWKDSSGQPRRIERLVDTIRQVGYDE